MSVIYTLRVSGHFVHKNLSYVLTLPDQNLVVSLDQNVLILLVTCDENYIYWEYSDILVQKIMHA